MSERTNIAKPPLPSSSLIGAGTKAPVLHHVSTRSVPASDRLHYWRSQFGALRIEKPHALRTHGFDAEMMTSAPVHGVVFADLRGDPITCHFGESESGTVLLGCIRSGVVNIRHGRDHAVSVTPHSGLVLFDCDRPFTTSSQHYAMTYLALPRNVVVEALNADPVAPGDAVRVLPVNALATSLQHHMRTVANHGARFAAVEVTDAMRVARALGVSMLAGLRPCWRSLPVLDDALLTSARYQLHQQAGDPQLTAGLLAASLGCSRAHLYRLFERQGQTVAGQLRESRLQRARTLLETSSDEPIGMIALRCGYTDLSAFGKAFRRLFGCAPSDCRHQARAMTGTRQGG